MDKNSLKMCADCINKQFVDIDANGRKRYYCAKVDGIVRNGIVLDSTDASACIKWGIFRDIHLMANN